MCFFLYQQNSIQQELMRQCHEIAQMFFTHETNETNETNETGETDETNTPGPLIDELVHFKVCLRDEDINFRIKIRKLCRHGVENLVFGNTV